VNQQKYKKLKKLYLYNKYKMPRGNPGVKRIGVKISEKQKDIIKQHQLKRAEESKKKWEEILNEGTMKCRQCKEEKSLNNYSPRKYENMQVYNKRCKKCEAEHKNKKHHERCINKGLVYNLNELLRCSKQRSNQYKRECTIDIPILKEVYEKQNGKCYYSKRVLSFEINNINKISIDRLDSNKGYIKENIVLCCKCINLMKLDWDKDVFLDWANAIYNNFK